MNIISLITQLIGLVLVAVVIWMVGPVVAIGDTYILESVLARGVAIGIAVVLWGVYLVWQRAQAKKKNDRMLSEIGSGQGQEVDEEQAIIQERFREAMAILRSSNKGKKRKTYIYDLPWYIIIGPPGSGKTTALVNSGLHFPLEEEFGSEALKGVGGTRHCDWWFTDEAVLIDTAGRFTSQDSHKSVDEAGWESFIQMLKKYRKERPINGAMVTMSLSDLMQQSTEERAATAKAVRQRIDELTEGLGIEFPIYFMFTKCDMVSGFTEYFSHFGAQERAQVWGETFGLTTKGHCALNVDEYGKHFSDLVSRLEAQVLDRIHEERERDTRAMMLGFPAQMLSLKDPICDFVSRTFIPSEDGLKPLLRGIYYTSGTQEGTPIDQLLGSLASDFGLGSSDDIFFSGQGKSYFISRLLKDVIFLESELAGEDKSAVRKKRLIGFASYGLAASLIAGSVGAWTLSYQSNVSEIMAVENALDQGRAQQSGAEQLADLAVELDGLREATIQKTEPFPSLGLQQADNVRRAADLAYEASLTNRLLPMLAARLEERLFDAVGRRDLGEVYRLLKAYLMYAGLHSNAGADLEPEFLFSTNQEDWETRFSDPELLSSLDLHQHRLVDLGLTPIFASDALVKRARAMLLASPLADQIYQSVKQTELQNHQYDLKFADVAGDSGDEVFVSRSNRDLSGVVVPGMFTRDGYGSLILPLVESKAREYVESNWVLGQHNKQDTPISFAELKRQVIDIYKSDYITQWRNLIDDLDIRKITRAEDGAEVIQTAAVIRGPIETVVLSMVKHTSLMQVEKQSVASLGENTVGSDQVSQAFSQYHQLATSASGPSALDRLVLDTRDLAVFIRETLLNQYADAPALSAIKRRVTGDSRDVFGVLRSQIPFLPPSVKRWMESIQESAWALVVAQARRELNEEWSSTVKQFHSDRLANRYPIDPDATAGVEPIDFVEFFSKGGVYQSFYDEHLSMFIEDKSGGWSLRKMDGESIGLRRSQLTELQKWQRVADAFFPTAASIGIRLTLTPVELAPLTQKFIVTFGDSQSVFEGSEGNVLSVDWPFRGSDRSWYQFSSELGPLEAEDVTGAWSMFQLLEKTEKQGTGRNTYRVTFNQGRHAAIYDLRITGAGDILMADLFKDLSLPENL